MKKVTDLIKGREEFSYSFEVTPDVDENELRNLSANPLFFSVTWHAKSHQCEHLNIAPLKMVYLLKSMNKDVLLHLSCDMLKENYLNDLLIMLQKKDICNLFVMLGENYDPNTSDFTNTTELIKYIRKKSGQYFCIGVAGFPGCSDEKLIQTKEKVDSGADFILTQAFFDTEVYVLFKEKCEGLGIYVPIIPGVFAFETYKQLTAFVNLCKIKVSDDLLQVIKNKETLNMPCIDLSRQLIQNLTSKCRVYHYHFFTLNKLQNICKSLQKLK